MADAAFWNDQESAQATIQAANKIKRWTEPLTDLESRLDDAELFAQMAEEDDSPEARTEAETALEGAGKLLERLESNFMLGGPDDDKGAIIEIHPGAGGTESQDWAEMLLRMYTRFCESEEWDHELLDTEPAEEAGIKGATLEVRESYAYGYLKGESGVHRLVRISPYDSAARRHTSFSSVWVYPVVDDNIEIEVNPSDIRIDTYRSSGAGGQHVNTTDSAVRITHHPTGIVVTSSEKSQHQNRDIAMKALKSRLYQMELDRRNAAINEAHESKGDAGWGNQIRSYVLQPYQMVKDLRTNYETSDTAGVLDGDLDGLMGATLALNVAGKSRAEAQGD
jgi:peptide chain release factor 2